MTFSHFHRPGFFAWLCFLSAFAVLIGLGAWQLERLQWKRALIAGVEAGKTAAALEGLPHDLPPRFQHVRVSGTFGQQEFHVTPRYYNNTLGYHLFSLFTLEDGRHVFVNRGWVPVAQKEPDTRRGSEAPAGRVTLTAIIREGNERNYFTPDSQPEKNIWFGRDIVHMAAFAGIKDILPYTLDVLGEPQAGVLPVPSQGEVKLRNDHLQYAVTWFLIALGALVVFAVFHHKGKQEA